MSNLLDPEMQPGRLITIPVEYPHPYDARKAALESVTFMTVDTPEELLANADKVLAWLLPPVVVVPPTETPADAQNPAQEPRTASEGTTGPSRG